MVERDAERMNLTRLRDILDAYGADPRRWPAAERDAALALLSGSEEARALRDEAAALDTLLDTAQVPAPSPELMAAILAGAAPAGWRRWLADFWPVGPVWQPASALAAAVVLGVAVGIGAPDLVLPDAADGAVAEVESLAFGPAFDLEDAL
jgi:hypothetical protein